MNNIEAYWSTFKNKNNITTDKYSAFAFGWPESMQNELAELVKSGIKTATTSAFELYEPNEEIPLIGEYNVILDGRGNPVCIT
ncbi:ASCH domain-containing protein, partial [Oenococcus oeni]